MPEEEAEFQRDPADIETEDISYQGPIGTFSDADRELLIESQCCVTGKEVKHSFCRYPDNERGTVMVMSREAMLKFSRKGQNLITEFERILEKRREAEKRRARRK
jgi:hypothetical protein